MLLHNFTQGIQPHLIRMNIWMLLERKAHQLRQIPMDIIGQQALGISDEVLSQSGPAAPQILGRVCQLVIVQLRQQTPIVVKHRRHPLDFQSIRIEQHSEIPIMTVSIQNDRIQHTHPP